MTVRRQGLEVVEAMEHLWGLTHALEARSKWMKRAYGVSGPQLLLVRLVAMKPGCSPGEAAEALRLHAGTVTRLVTGLEALGMMRRTGHGEDGRRVRLDLTARGRRLTRLRAGTVHRAVARALAGARPGEAAAATAFIRRLAAELMPG